ncbi:esterase/lipase family protein [Pseudorhodoferax sp.]|uniref:esterase/lipase family protein n=1 Tax=Pseudorhodoferax sp. TaxID=1993553 RepID=UPI002DD66BC3|nr:alpha/beta hydrolase [Pseudorhodoferax sp.]
MDEPLWQRVDTLLAPLLPAGPQPADSEVPIQLRRRRGYAPYAPVADCVKLVRDDEGLLRWQYEMGRHPVLSGQRAWRADALEPVKLLWQRTLAPHGGNPITQSLSELDLRLNADAHHGLVCWDPGQRAWRVPDTGELHGLAGRVLLLVHGTFSQAGMFSAELGDTERGQRLLAHFASQYQAVLAFQHPTLSVAPWLNAVQLRGQLAALEHTELDIVCHSRGGLVVAWALKLAPLPMVRRVVFVGSPLAGTSLAEPARLRVALDFMANMAQALDQAGASAAAVSMAAGVAGLAMVCGRVLQLGTVAPAADVAVGLVPGLLAQNRMDQNLELKALYPFSTQARLTAICAKFRPDQLDATGKAPWRWLKARGWRWSQAGMDQIFKGDHDLVVDSDSMHSTLAGLADQQVLDAHFDIHHGSYFRSEAVLDLLERDLSAPV